MTNKSVIDNINSLYKGNFISVFAVFCIFCVSCQKNWLDAKPDQSLAVPQSYKDFQAMLDFAQQLNNQCPALGEMGSDGHYLSDGSFLSCSNQEINAYTWSNSLPYTKLPDWDVSYSNIFTCNVILDGLTKIKPSNIADLASWNNIEGQALFQRSKAFYEIAQIWAPPFDSSSENTDLGIPLRLNQDVNLPTTRSTITQTYNQIIQDLKTAVSALPVVQAYKTRASKVAAFAELARVYINIGSYQLAFLYSDSCLSTYSTLLNYNTLDSTSPFPIELFNSEVIFESSLENYFSINSNIVLVDSSLYAMYDSNDLRRPIFFNINPDSTISFKGSYYGNSNQFNGLAVDEQFLIRAEASARMGDITSAMADLNLLLAKRWRTGTFITASASSVSEALSLILRERQKELLLRGLRWGDLRRLNKEAKFNVTLTRTVQGKTFSIAPNSYQYTLPIPVDVVQLAGIKQNQGW